MASVFDMCKEPVQLYGTLFLCVGNQT